MSTFAAAFRELVMPDLRQECSTHALSVAWGACSFTEAHDAVHKMARARGALHLPDNILLDLEEWIDTTILKVVVDIETRPEAAREIAEASWQTMA